MPEEKRVFDVSKPGHTSPPATSKPVIVGHHPIMSDPMVRDRDESEGTRIAVRHGSSAVSSFTAGSQADEQPLQGPQLPDFSAEAPKTPEPEPARPPAGLVIEPPSAAQHPAAHPAGFSEPPPAEKLPAAELPPEPVKPVEPEPPVKPLPHSPAHVEELHVANPRRRKSPLGKIVMLVLLLLIALYLLIDSGVISSGINLPFHVFKQKTPAPAAVAPPPSASAPQAAGPAVPAGFNKYKLAGTSITFAAPAAWGTPTSSDEQGYSARGGANKPDGIYAYIVNFPNNKDVQVAVTSSQYLPPARTSLYYDYLQWCTGTNDGKIYLSLLHFTTANKIDTPSTITCDQGPLAPATKLDATTLVQPKAKYVSGQLLGDLYTKNLPNADLPVFRVKDAKSANADDIKQLLATVQEPASAAAASSSSP